jgi:hypothetical protein
VLFRQRRNVPGIDRSSRRDVVTFSSIVE